MRTGICNGGSAWESNPPGRVRRDRTGFEDRGAHRDPTAPVADGTTAPGRRRGPGRPPLRFGRVVYCCLLGEPEGGDAGDLYRLRRAERRGTQVLPGVRRVAGGRVPGLRLAEPAGARFCGECGARLAGRGDRATAVPPGRAHRAARRPGRRASPRLRPLRRPRRLHDARRAPGRGGGPRPPVALLRPRARDRRAPRRHDREVHRRRRDGRLGHADQPRGRRRARRARRPGARRRRARRWARGPRPGRRR